MHTLAPRLTIPQLKALFERFNVQPSKRWGQNFLINQHAIQTMVDGLNPSSTDRIIEIGGGLGAITLAVAPHVGSMTVFEIDPKLATVLTGLVKENGCEHKVQLVQGDFLKASADVMEEGGFKIIASLPYGVTSPILHQLVIDYHAAWQVGIFLMQKEVMEKIVAAPPQSSYWYHLLHRNYHVEVLERVVSPNSFWPLPGVDSSIIRVTKKLESSTPDMQSWSDFVHRVFQFPRKQIGKIFNQDQLVTAQISSTMRPGELTLEDMQKLFRLA